MMEPPKGILYTKTLPDPSFDDLWNQIVLAPGEKKRLVNQIVLEFTARKHANAAAVPLHGVLLLAGPPGTGKTSLAKGAASQASHVLKGAKFQFAQVEPHALTSAQLGKSQQAVHGLLRGPIKELASQGPTVILLDEVETLATNRSRLSLEANPVDVHRATDALLAGLDLLATEHRDLIFLATTNFEAALDPAFFSRADFVMRVPLPDKAAREAILQNTFEALGKKWPGIKALGRDGKLSMLGQVSEGLDGRQIAKAVLAACAADDATAVDPGKLSAEQLRNHFLSMRGKPK